MNHRIWRLVFAFGVGLVVALLAFKWITNPAPRIERQEQEAAVMSARLRLGQMLSLENLELIDPLAADRKVGKAYVYRANGGWEVSGYYRRGQEDSWQPFLMTLDEAHGVVKLKIRDSAFAARAEQDPKLEVVQ